MKVYVDGDGCILRKLDTKKVSAYFAANQAEVLQTPDDAEHIFYITCGVTKMMVDNSIAKVRNYSIPGKKLTIGGCLPEIAPHLLNEASSHHQKLATRNLEQIDSFFPDFQVKFKDVQSPTAIDSHETTEVRHLFNFSRRDIVNFSKGPRFLQKYQFYSFHRNIAEKQFAFLVTSKGCDRHCTYCGIKTAVGALRSMSKQEALDSYLKMQSDGYDHIFFFSDDTGAYGKDNGESFSDLLLYLDQHSNIDVTWGFVNLHPQSLIKHFNAINELAKKKRIVFIECAIQHFSPSVLKRMNRHYDVEELVRCVNILKTSFPNLCISTHFIFGFPGETEADIAIAGRYVERINIDQYDLLMYFENGTTPSAKLDGKVMPEEVHTRVKYFNSILSKKGTLHSVFPVQLIDDDFDDRYILFKKRKPMPNSRSRFLNLFSFTD